MSAFGGAPKCASCEKSVYFNEQFRALDKIWHKRCFKCQGECGKRLQLGEQNENNGMPYCKRCYGKQFGPKGYGFGNLTMTETGPEQATEKKKESLVKRVSMRVKKTLTPRKSSSNKAEKEEEEQHNEEKEEEEEEDKLPKVEALGLNNDDDDDNKSDQGYDKETQMKSEKKPQAQEERRVGTTTAVDNHLQELEGGHVSLSEEERRMLDQVLNPEKYMEKSQVAYKRKTLRLKCQVCNQDMGHAEMVEVMDKKMHKKCFKCGKCNKRLTKGQHFDHQGEPYCNPCYKKNYAPKGYGYGVGAGVMQSSS